MSSIKDRTDWALREFLSLVEAAEKAKMTETATLGLCIVFAANMIVDKMEEMRKDS